MGKAANDGANKAPDPLIGRVISDRYRVLSLLAKGGMGRVYRAEQQPLGRQIALKVLAVKDAEDDPDFRRRFLLEASICARLKHPNTVTIFDYGRTEDDVYYIAMELLEGRSLRRAIRSEAPFGVARATHITLQIARSLREAHGLGVIHRDLKPGNVHLVKHDEDPDYAKVLDFGLVKVVKGPDEDLTLTGQFMGSPKYMPPEQIRGQPVDARSDIYALGAILFEMVAGHPPYERQNPMDVLLAHLNEPLPSMATIAPEAPVASPLEAVARRCLEKAPMDRYASMDELIGALREAAQQADVSLPAGSSTSRSLSSAAVERVMASMAPMDSDALEISAIETSPPLAVRRRATVTIVLALLLVVALGGAAAWMVGRRSLPAPAPETTLPSEPASAPGPEPEAVPPAPAPASPGPLTLRSSPSGAKVTLGETVVCPATPCEGIELPPGLRVGEVHLLTFDLRGHSPGEIGLTLEATSMEQEMRLGTLYKKPTRRPRRGKPVRKPTPDPGEGVPPEGYKENPY